MAMLPFCRYTNMADYWLDISPDRGAKLPKIFHVNWFLHKDGKGFIWPRIRRQQPLAQWVFNRCDDRGGRSNLDRAAA